MKHAKGAPHTSRDKKTKVNHYCTFASATFATHLMIRLHDKTSGLFCINVRNFYAIHGKVINGHLIADSTLDFNILSSTVWVTR